ncbi:MAG: hypothetical protein KJ697_02395, partial [Nanoarchaeota archaeon]|nr:hypothetical protein [Nanoarchaeota archaeon]
TGYYTFENKNYKIQTNKTFGGLMYSAYNKLGSNTNLSGLNPMQSMPEVRYDELTLCSMKDYSSPQITVENGPMFTRYVASGKMGTCGINYNLTYIFYSNSPYFSVETKVAPTDARTWFDYRDQRLIIKDSKFDNVTIRNSTGVFEQLVISGDGTEWTNQGDLKWIGLYNKTSKDSIGDVFVNRLQLTVSTPDVDFTDSSSYEYYTRTIIENYNVIISDYFYSKIARTLWDSSDGYSELNSIYNQTSNISVVTASATSVYDTEAPKFNESDERLNYRPQTPADTNDITCYSFWTDNLEMDYVIVRENATGSFRDHTVSLTGNTSGWANYTINNTDIETGNITCNFTGYDIASLSNSTNFTFHVSDTTHPNITNISYVPTTTADLDPNVQINVSVNVTDYGTIDTVILQNRTNDTGNWTNTTMRLLSGNLYNASFTPIQEANHTIRIIANDTLNNVNISSSQNITVGYDRVWYLIPSDFGEVPILIDATKNAVNLTINNTGDYDMNFSISTNYPSGQTFYNVTHSTKINVNNLSFTVVQVNFTAQNTPQSNAITITVTANETTQNSTSQISTGTLVTIPPGPYLYTEFITYPSSIVGSNQTNLSVKITNHGNETATDAWVAYTLPTGWTNISGALNKTLGNMGENEIAWNNITVNVTTLASTGDQTIFVESNSSTGGYNNDSVTVTIIGVTVVATTVETISSTGGGGGGGGGMSVGGSSDKLFQTSEIFEMIRGEYSSFPLTIENPFTNSTMENVTIKVTGLLSKYVTVFPEKLSKLSPKNSYNFTIKINA